MKRVKDIAIACLVFHSSLTLAGRSAFGQNSGQGFEQIELKHGQAYRLFEPKSKRQEYRLLVILPGGNGSESFTPWCQAIYRQSIPADFLAVQMIAPPWKTPNATWPTEFSPTEGMRSSVEETFAEVVKDVGTRFSIKDGEIYTLSWSSGGPAAYLIAATQRDVRGHFVAMSVFRENWLPKRLSRVKGQRFFIYHSPDDRVCPVGLAREAQTKLSAEGAETKFQEYSGGHGWTTGLDHFQTIREAFDWMVKE